jgi:hypothetical protein
VADHLSPVLIGITGRFGTGKSTLAGYLAEMIQGAQVVAFADALKLDVRAILPELAGVELSAERLEELKAECLGPMYQGYGELMRRCWGDDYWIGRLAPFLPPRAIVADVRYPNEAVWLRSRGGLLVAVSGPCRRPGDTRSADHPSERHVEEVARGADVPVVNDWTLEGLRSEAGRIARMALRRAGVAT